MAKENPVLPTKTQTLTTLTNIRSKFLKERRQIRVNKAKLQ
jgi:hypothetical protein